MTLRAARPTSRPAPPAGAARAPGPRAPGPVAALLRAPDDLVHLAFLVRRLADVDGAGDVRPVAVAQPAQVEHDHVAHPDHPLAHVVVRVGAVGAGADDRELHARMPVPLEPGGEL